MLISAYARRRRGLSISGQLHRLENWALSQGHSVLRLTDQRPADDAAEHPPRQALLLACRLREIEAVLVADMDALGPDLARTLGSIDRTGARLLLASEDGFHSDLGSDELRVAKEIAQSAARGAMKGGRKRVCPMRVSIDMDRVRALQARGARLIDIANTLRVSRSSISRRLRREREAAEAERGEV